MFGGCQHVRKSDVGDSTDTDERDLKLSDALGAVKSRQVEKRCLRVLGILREDHYSSDPSPEAK